MNNFSVPYTQYGWEKDSQSKLVIMTLPEPIKVAPPEVLKIIKCGCKSKIESLFFVCYQGTEILLIE